MLVSLNSVSIPCTFYNIREGVTTAFRSECGTLLIQRQASCLPTATAFVDVEPFFGISACFLTHVPTLSAQFQ